MRVVGRPWTAGAHKRKGVAPGPAGAAAWPTDGSAGARERGMGEAREALGPTTELSLAAARVTREGGRVDWWDWWPCQCAIARGCGAGTRGCGGMTH